MGCRAFAGDAALSQNRQGIFRLEGLFVIYIIPCMLCLQFSVWARETLHLKPSENYIYYVVIYWYQMMTIEGTSCLSGQSGVIILRRKTMKTKIMSISVSWLSYLCSTPWGFSDVWKLKSFRTLAENSKWRVVLEFFSYWLIVMGILQVLIMDEITVRVMSCSCKMADITDEGISCMYCALADSLCLGLMKV